MDFGPDLTPYEEEMPKAWQDMLDDMEKSGGNINHRESVKARIDIALMADQIMHEQYGADVQRKHEKRLEDRREAFQETMTKRAEDFQIALEQKEQQRHDAAMSSAELDRTAAKNAAEATARSAKALNWATWVLAAATVVLVYVTAAHGG